MIAAGRRLFASTRYALLMVLVLPLALGCGVVNPNLLGTVGASPVPAIDEPQGAIIIAVMNRTPQVVSAKIVVRKTNGGQLELDIPLQAYPTAATTNVTALEQARRVVVQDCDVVSIQLTQVLVATASGVQPLISGGSNFLLTSGASLSCGKLVAITILGRVPNVVADVKVY